MVWITLKYPNTSTEVSAVNWRYDETDNFYSAVLPLIGLSFFPSLNCLQPWTWQIRQDCRNYKKKKKKRISSEKWEVTCHSLGCHHVSVSYRCFTEGDRLKVLQSYLLGVQQLLPNQNLRKWLCLWNNLRKKEINHQRRHNWTYGVNQLHDPRMVKNK